MEKLFSLNEMKVLRNHDQYHRMLELASMGPNLSSIHMKSIILARQERRSLRTDGDCGENNDWKSYPLTPRQLQPSIGASAAKNDTLENNANDNCEEVYLTELSNEKTRRETFTKDMARYYEEVKVCDVCYKYYLLLDWARNVLDTAAQLRGKDNLMQLSRRQINSSERLLSANSLTKTDSHRVPLLDEKHQASSDLNHIQVATMKKSKNTWKSYTNTTTQEGSSSFSRDQFADLDDYLRKGTAAVAKRRLNEKNSKIQHILGSNKHVGSSIDESTVYRGRIMLACGEGDDASLRRKF